MSKTAAQLLESLNKHLSEKVDELPPGFVAKRANTTVKAVSRSGMGEPIDFLVTGKIYDEYLKDQIASISYGRDLEKEIDAFRKAGYTDDEIEAVYDEVRAARPHSKVELPKPVSITFTVLKRG